ncbi:MAG TPA: hypothetical protein VKS79_07380 [Gemmataceae bacterium]|nr:hypothetical protein [Gemmataceae bacterium]
MRTTFLTITMALLATLQFAAPSRADDNAANKRPKVSKMTIDNAGTKTVYYSVTNGTPHLNALYRKLEFAENEVTIVQQLQMLRLDYIRSERTREASSAIYGISAPNFNGMNGGADGSYGSYGSYGGGNGESSLKNGLSQVLAAEGTPDAAMQAIQVLERAETEAANELKLLTPQDQQQLKDTTKKLHDFVVSQTPNAAPAASK